MCEERGVVELVKTVLPEHHLSAGEKLQVLTLAQGFSFSHVAI